MTPTEMKALGDSVWGSQAGLLSVAELTTLMSACRHPMVHDVLEVGHYCGLSTCAIVTAMREQCGADWLVTSVDAHIPDPWVSNAAAIETFERNRAAHFDDQRLTVRYELSQTISGTNDDLVFYDGDHGEEQLRFTRMVIGSNKPHIFLFDDRDFDFPRKCCEELIAAGWVDKSPPLKRLPGDKCNPDTQTIGWFERC